MTQLREESLAYKAFFFQGSKSFYNYAMDIIYCIIYTKINASAEGLHSNQ